MNQNNRKKKLNLNDVKRWISSEISRLWLLDTNEFDQNEIIDVNDTHPLYPIIEMMKTLASRSFDKQKRIFDLESENSKLKSEVRSLEGKTPHLIRNKIDREKKEIERELNIWVKTDPSHKLQKVLEILSIFGINVHDEIDSSSSKKINGSPNNKLVGHLKKDSTSSEPFNYKQRAIDYENLESFENVVKESTNSKANETSESWNCEEVDIKEYALSIDGNEESFEQIERDKLGLNQPHQIWNIQINELRKYIKQIEEENQAIEKRLEEQIIINQELEKKNILLNSNFVNKTDEVEILKKWMNENKEITKDLKTILSGVSNSFDMYHTLYNEKALSSSWQGLRFNPYNTSQSNYGKNSSQNFNNMKKEQRIPLDKRAKSLSKALRK